MDIYKVRGNMQTEEGFWLWKWAVKTKQQDKKLQKVYGWGEKVRIILVI